MLAVTGSVWDGDDLSRVASDPLVGTMGKDDFLVVLGDCGVMDPKKELSENIREFRELPCSVLFVDGSREDYDALDDHPLFPWNGGLIQNISRGILRLTRGQVFTIFGKTFLTLGGAATEGRSDRGKYYDWWPEQDPLPSDAENAVRNVTAVGGKVDFVLSCECPRSWRNELGAYGTSAASDVLQDVLDNVTYGHWYFGNYPVDRDLADVRASVVKDRVIRLV